MCADGRAECSVRVRRRGGGARVAVAVQRGARRHRWSRAAQVRQLHRLRGDGRLRVGSDSRCGRRDDRVAKADSRAEKGDRCSGRWVSGLWCSRDAEARHLTEVQSKRRVCMGHLSDTRIVT